MRVLPSLWCSAPCILILGYSAAYQRLPATAWSAACCPRGRSWWSELLRLAICAGPAAGAAPSGGPLGGGGAGLVHHGRRGAGAGLCAGRPPSAPVSPWTPPEAWRKPVLRLALPTTGTRLLQMLLRAVEAVWIPLRLQASGLARPGRPPARLGMLSGMVTPVLMLPCVFTGSLSMVLLPRIALAEKESPGAAAARRQMLPDRRAQPGWAAPRPSGWPRPCWPAGCTGCRS